MVGRNHCFSWQELIARCIEDFIPYDIVSLDQSGKLFGDIFWLSNKAPLESLKAISRSFSLCIGNILHLFLFIE